MKFRQIILGIIYMRVHYMHALKLAVCSCQIIYCVIAYVGLAKINANAFCFAEILLYSVKSSESVVCTFIVPWVYTHTCTRF